MSRFLAASAIGLLAFNVSAVFGAEKTTKKITPPLYHQAVPDHLCVSAKDLDTSTKSCADNQIFLTKANECWARVKKIHEQVSEDFKSVTALNSTASQSQDFNSSKATQAEAVLAHDYMLKVTENALNDLDQYFDYVVQPDDVETDEEVMAAACYSEAVIPMDKIAEEMEDKIDEMKASKGMEASMGKTSAKRETNVGTVSPGAAKGGKSVKGAPDKVKSGSSKKTSSTVTGVEEDKKKQAPLPKK